MVKSYKYRIYPNVDQKILLNKHFGCSRFIYNWSLKKKITIYEAEKKSLSAFDLNRELTKLKQQEENNWLYEVSNASLQASIGNLDKAFKGFFNGKGFPKFKNKHTCKSSYQLPSCRIDFSKQELTLLKIPYIK